jgi:class 3 adenylate cyclase
VSSLVLLEGFSRITRAADYPAGTPSDVVDAATAAYIDMYGTGEDLAWFAPSLANDLHFRDWWARCERLANGPVGAALYWQELASRDMRAVLPALRMPTLIVHRREDQFIRVEHGRYLAERIPGATYVELDGDDHMFFTGDSDQIVDEIEVFLTGVRAAPDIDRMLASVLFTDIVASTDKAAALGDRRWREILDQHDALTRSQVARFRGRVVKTTGDGTLATFDGPARAIQCACVLRDAAHDMGLELRAGIHTGEVERRDDDVGGIAVHLAARVQSVARPDEVIVSRTVTDLVAGSGIAFHDRGEHDLKGIPGQWRLFAVAG